RTNAERGAFTGRAESVDDPPHDRARLAVDTRADRNPEMIENGLLRLIDRCSRKLGEAEAGAILRESPADLCAGDGRCGHRHAVLFRGWPPPALISQVPRGEGRGEAREGRSPCIGFEKEQGMKATTASRWFAAAMTTVLMACMVAAGADRAGAAGKPIVI